MDDLLAKLDSVGMHRLGLSPQLTSNYAEREGSQQLIFSVASAIAGRQKIPGLQHHSASLRNMINSGLGRFGIKQKVPMPHDHEKIILFFVGGISIADIRAMTQAVEASQSDTEGTLNFICGGTTLVSPSDVLDQFFRT